VNFADLLTDALGYTADECVSISTAAPGSQFRSVVVPVIEAVALVESLGSTVSVYHSVNAVTCGGGSGRGGVDDVTRLAAAVVDLDVKPGGCRDLRHAREILAGIAALIGAPSAVVRSGGGLHGYWSISDGQIGSDADRARAVSLLKRFGDMCRRVAREHGAEIDSVFDLARVMRTPGSWNIKSAPPELVVAEMAPGEALTVAGLSSLLDRLGVAAPEPVSTLTVEQTWAAMPTKDCDYAKQARAGWRDDVPTEGRHQWLLSQMVRVAAMKRRGCLTAAGVESSRSAVAARFRVLCADRDVPAPEVPDAIEWGENLVAGMSDEEVHAELGGHAHLEDLLADGPVTVEDAVTEVSELFAMRDDEGVDDGGEVDESDLAPNAGTVPRTDDGAAMLVVRSWKGNLLFAPDLNRWLIWDGSRWRLRPDDSPAYIAVRRTIRAIRAGADVGVLAWQRQLQSASKISGVAALVRRDPAIHTSADDLDSNGWILNAPNGLICLRSGDVSPADPAARCTLSTGVPVDPDMATPRFLEFMDRTFGGDAELISYIQRWAGKSAIGEMTSQTAAFCNGEGANGKSVLVEVLAGVLGEYAAIMPPDFLLADRGDRHETEIARLRGVRLAVASEVNGGNGGSWDETKLKALTGDGTLIGRAMRQDHFEFTNRLTLWITGNHMPVVKSGGHSFWRRLRRIPFNYIVPVSEQKEGLADSLIASEGPGILWWIVQGALNFQRFGDADPPAVLEATAEYRLSEDQLGRFAEEALVFGGGDTATIASNSLYVGYRSWCRDHGEDELTERAFMKELRARWGVEPIKVTGGHRHRSNVSWAETRTAATPVTAEDFLR
jgi:P4 family phage/plasmid primase-like protien